MDLSDDGRNHVRLTVSLYTVSYLVLKRYKVVYFDGNQLVLAN